ncbi:hypothetical protein GJAV_G00032650 [Gymnothorax javanicus]|nr:hypothetical protein GJAV_G00032650 [Gymnothorax javanicus]
MAAKDCKALAAGFEFKWTNDLTAQLILWRSANENLFTGKRNASLRGFEVFIKEMGLEGKVSVTFVKKKWENLKQRYKELKNPPPGKSTEGEMTAASWKWYKAMEAAVENGYITSSVVVGSPSSPGDAVFSVPPEETAADPSSGSGSGSPALVFIQQYKQMHLPMATQDLNAQATGYAFKWTDQLTKQLIMWRAANKRLFTGKRNAALMGFEMFIKEMGLEGKVTVAFAKKKWENLKQKYKLLKNPAPGRTAERGEVTAATWKWYRAMAVAVEDNDTMLALDSSSIPEDTVFFPSEETSAATGSISNFSPSIPTSFIEPLAEPPASSPPPKRSRKEPEWLQAIRELEKREEARDARQAEWERAMMEREKRRDQEMLEREERRDQEMRRGRKEGTKR